jgi:hypothetical protein
VYVDRALVGLLLKVPEETLLRHLACSPSRLGWELAKEIDSYVREQSLGYYPALEYFRKVDAIDKDLLDSADQVSWLMSKLARVEVQVKLRPIFSKVQFQSVQTLAFTMPPVRPNQAKALDKLAAFYTPTTVKLELVLSMIRKDSDTAERKVETYARKMVYRWLRESFESVEVTSSAEI